LKCYLSCIYRDLAGAGRKKVWDYVRTNGILDKGGMGGMVTVRLGVALTAVGSRVADSKGEKDKKEKFLGA